MPEQGYVLSATTAARLRELLRIQGLTPGIKGGNGQSIGPRFVTFVEVTGPVEDDGWYPCVPTSYLSYSDVWEDFQPAWVKGANDEALTEGNVYLALQAADDPDDGKATFVTYCCPEDNTDPYSDIELVTGASLPAHSGPSTLTIEGDLAVVCLTYTAASEATVTADPLTVAGHPNPIVLTPLAHGSYGTGRFYWTGYYHAVNVDPFNVPAIVVLNLSVAATLANCHTAWYVGGVPQSWSAATGTGVTITTLADVAVGDEQLLVFTVFGDPFALTATTQTTPADMERLSFVQPNPIVSFHQSVPDGGIAAKISTFDVSDDWAGIAVVIRPGALGTMAHQNASNVAITGGTITGLTTPLPPGSGGTGLTSLTGSGPPGALIGSPGSVYFDVSDPDNPSFYYKD